MTAVYTEVGNLLDSQNGSYSVSGYQNTAYTVSQVGVSWATEPSLKEESTTTVTLNLQSNNANGEIACVILNEKSHNEYTTNNEYKPSAEQIYLGLDANNAEAV